MANFKIENSLTSKKTILCACTREGKVLVELRAWSWRVHGAQGAYQKAARIKAELEARDD